MSNIILNPNTDDEIKIEYNSHKEAKYVRIRIKHGILDISSLWLI